MSEIKLKTIKFPGLSDTYVIPQKVSDLTNDAGYISTIPTYNASQIVWSGAAAYGNNVQSAIEYIADSIIGAMRSSY